MTISPTTWRSGIGSTTKHKGGGRGVYSYGPIRSLALCLRQCPHARLRWLDLSDNVLGGKHRVLGGLTLQGANMESPGVSVRKLSREMIIWNDSYDSSL